MGNKRHYYAYVHRSIPDSGNKWELRLKIMYCCPKVTTSGKYTIPQWEIGKRNTLEHTMNIITLTEDM